ncbi:MAG: hypothetical protein M1839_001852 [Geoglossum umbratile]|nr:MAG: hypothetical protein M1839_001852 [Geoglossum umbratile]
MLPNRRAQPPSHTRRSAESNAPKRQKSHKGKSVERGDGECVFSGIGGRETRDDSHYVLPTVSGRGTRDYPRFTPSPDQDTDGPRAKLREEIRPKQQERGSAREFLSRSVGRAKGILTMRPRKGDANPGVASTERSADSVQPPRINVLRGSGEHGSISRASQPESWVNWGAESSRISRSDLVPPSAIPPPPRSSQPGDASDPRTLSERLAETSWNSMFANIPPINSSEESKSSGGLHINTSAASATYGLPTRSQLENMVNFPEPLFPSPTAPTSSDSGEPAWAPLFPEVSRISSGSAADTRHPSPHGSLQREPEANQPPAHTIGNGIGVNDTPAAPGVSHTHGSQLTPSLSNTLMVQRRPSRRREHWGEPREDAPPVTSLAEGNQSQTMNPEWPPLQPRKDNSFHSFPPPPGSGIRMPMASTAYPGDGLGEDPHGGPPRRPWAVMVRETQSENGQKRGGEPPAQPMPWRYHPTSFQGPLPPGLPIPYTALPITPAPPTYPGPFQPVNWGAGLSAAANSTNSPVEGAGRGGESSSQRPRTPTPSRRFDANSHQQLMDSAIDVVPEIRTDLGAAGSEFPSRKPHRAKSTMTNWRKKAGINVRGFKNLSKRAVGRTSKVAGALVRGGMKAFRPLKSQTSQERYDKYVEVINKTAIGVPPSSCEVVDIKALQRKKSRYPKRMTSEELRVLALASMDVDYNALVPGSETSGVHHMSEGGIDKWQDAIEPHEDGETAGCPPLDRAESRSPTSPPLWFLTTPEGLGVVPGILQQGSWPSEEGTLFGQAVNTSRNVGPSANHPVAARPQIVYTLAPPDHPRHRPRPGLSEAQLQIDDPRFRPDPSTRVNAPSPPLLLPGLATAAPPEPLPDLGELGNDDHDDGDDDDDGRRVFERRGAISGASSPVEVVCDPGVVVGRDPRGAGLVVDADGTERRLLVPGSLTSRSPRSRRSSRGSRRSSRGSRRSFGVEGGVGIGIGGGRGEGEERERERGRGRVVENRGDGVIVE